MPEPALGGLRPDNEPEMGLRAHERQKVSVVVSSFKEPACLQRQVDLWQKCPVVHTVHVNWSDGQGGTPRPIWQRAANLARVVIDEWPNSLSHRFAPRDFQTEAVFSVDVDVLYSCRALLPAFRVWREHPRRMVGFHARHVYPGFDAYKDQAWRNSYDWPKFPHNLILATKGGMQHRDTFKAYFDKQYDAVRMVIDKNLQGEDYLMSFVQARHFDARLQFICVGWEDSCQTQTCTEGKGTLSQTTGRKRKHVLNMLFEEFGDPLVLQIGQKHNNVSWFPDNGDHTKCHTNPKFPYNTDLSHVKLGGCTSSWPLLWPKPPARFSSEYQEAYYNGKLTWQGTA